MQSVRDKALYLLARRDHTRRELQQKLTLRGFASSAINAALDELENENLLDEERFISSFIRIRRFRGFGPLKICVELRKRGIDRHRITANEEWQASAWQESAMAARIKRFGETSPLDANERARQARFLQQRGFTADQIGRALSV